MVDSKHCSANVVTVAMAWRAKYSKLDHDGKPLRTTERIDHLGVHPQNRGGVCPAGVSCMALWQDVVGAGFVKEFNLGVVVAKEPPPLHDFAA